MTTLKDLRAFHVLELLLCALVAAMLARTVQGGFYVPDALHDSYLANCLVCLVLQGILFVEVLRPGVRWASRAAYAVVCIVAIAASVVQATTLNPVEDVGGNYFVACMIFAIVNAAVFALSRRHATTLALLVAGGFVAGYIQLMYLSNMLVTTVVFLFAGLALLVLRAYLDTRAVAASCDPLAGKATLATFGFPLAVALLASFVVIGVIMPLNPPNAVIELQTEYLKYPEQYVKSAVSLSENQDETESTSDVDKDLDAKTTTDEKDDTDAEQANASGKSDDREDDVPDQRDYLSGDYSDVDLSSVSQGITALALNEEIPWLLIVLAIILVLVGILTIPRYVVHRRRLARIKALAPRDQVVALYRFFLGRFAKLGFKRPANLSAADYANLFRARLKPFVGAQSAGSFDHLTAIYIAQEYGAAEVDPGDLEALYYLYERFYPNVRREVGTLPYLFRYFFL